MPKMEKGQKSEGKDVMSSSFDNWEYRIENGGGPGWSKRINDAPKTKKGD